MPSVAVVTDSTACLPPSLVTRYEIIVVPLQVVIGGESRAEGVDVQPHEVAAALRRGVLVTTSRPSPRALLVAYRAAGDAGHREVVSVHLSADMSGTVEAARLAARPAADAGVAVTVVDSRSLAMGLGAAVLAAARTAQEGGSAAAVAEQARRVGQASSVWFCVDTLDHLRRGGRISAAEAVLGSALAVKPLLRMVDGRIRPVEKVRTTSRALARLEDLAAAAAERIDGPVDVVVHHLDAAERAGQVAENLRWRVERLHRLTVREVGAVVGAHVGPGMIGLVVAPG